MVLKKYTYFNIAQNGTVTLTDESGTGTNSNENASLSNSGNIITIKNTPGASLPSTGGPGAIRLYLLGILLIGTMGGALLLRRRRTI